MRLPGRKKAADQDVIEPGPAPAPLAPSIAANVLPGVALPGWAVYTLQANAAGGPQAPVVGAGWGAADPEYGGGQEFSDTPDPELEAGAYAVAQTSVLAAWEASWEWQQDAGPSPEELLRQADLGAAGFSDADPATIVSAEADLAEAAGPYQVPEVHDLPAAEAGEEDLAALFSLAEGTEPEPDAPGAALPESGLDIPVAEPEFLVDQPSVEEAQAFGLALDEDGFPIVEEGQPESVAPEEDPAGSWPVADDGALAVTDEPVDALPLADDDDLPVAEDTFDAIPVADDSNDAVPIADEQYDAIPVADEQYDAIPVADEQYDAVPIADDGDDSRIAPNADAWEAASPGWDFDPQADATGPSRDEGSLTVTDSDADVDLDPAAAASAPPPDGMLPDQQPTPPDLPRTADDSSDFPWRAIDLGPGQEQGSPPEEMPTQFTSIPAADEPSLDVHGEDQLPPPDHEAAQSYPGESEIQVDDDLWQALAMAAEEAGRGGAGATESANGDEENGGDEDGAAPQDSGPR